MEVPPPGGETQTTEARDSVHGALEALARALHVADVTVRHPGLTGTPSQALTRASRVVACADVVQRSANAAARRAA